jgi:hypothetical protein
VIVTRYISEFMLDNAADDSCRWVLSSRLTPQRFPCVNTELYWDFVTDVTAVVADWWRVATVTRRARLVSSCR